MYMLCTHHKIHIGQKYYKMKKHHPTTNINDKPSYLLLSFWYVSNMPSVCLLMVKYM